MSELTTCNYCNHQSRKKSIKRFRRAREDDKQGKGWKKLNCLTVVRVDKGGN